MPLSLIEVKLVTICFSPHGFSHPPFSKSRFAIDLVPLPFIPLLLFLFFHVSFLSIYCPICAQIRRSSSLTRDPPISPLRSYSQLLRLLIILFLLLLFLHLHHYVILFLPPSPPPSLPPHTLPSSCLCNCHHKHLYKSCQPATSISAIRYQLSSN